MISQVDIDDMAEVMVYSSPTCQPCKSTKAWLAERGIPFAERDVTASPDAMSEIQALGYRGVPVVVAGDRHWQGHSPARLGDLVAR